MKASRYLEIEIVNISTDTTDYSLQQLREALEASGDRVLEKLKGDEDQRRFFPIELNGPLANEWKVPYKIREPQPGEEEDREEETHGVKTLTAHQQRVLREYVQMDLPIPSEDEREILARKVKKEKREEGDREPPPPPPAPLAAARTLSEAVMRTGDARLAERNSLGPLGRHWRKK